MKHYPLLLALLVFLSLAALPGCPGSLEDPGRFAAQFGTCPDIPMFFADTCTASGCHSATKPAGGLDLTSGSDDLFTRLSGKKAMGGTGLLVDPGEPSSSVIYEKLTDAPPFGSRMPLTGAPLDPTTVDCVLTWIETSTKGSP
jgi:hypothetical protein